MLETNLMLVDQIHQGFAIFIRILEYVLFAYCVMSWFASPHNRVYVFLSRFVQPLVRPFRPLSNYLIRRGLPFDTSAIFAFVALSVVLRLLSRLFVWIKTLLL